MAPQRTRRLTAVFVAFALVSVACTGGDSADTAVTAAPDETESVIAGSVLAEALVATGVTVVDEPGAAGPVTSMQLWSFEVENMDREIEAGSGYLGTQLDELLGAPGGLPFSYLLAGWINSSDTPAGLAAAEIMGDQQWELAPSIIFPTGVLVLFLSDAVAAGSAHLTSQGGEVVLASLAQEGICSTLMQWASDALDYIVDVLTIETEGNWFREYIGPAWNFAVGLARDTLEATVGALTAPIVATIKSILFVAAVATKVFSVLNTWSVEVTPSRPVTRFAVGEEPDIEEHFIAEVDTNVDVSWNPHILDCSAVVGMPLPDPTTAVGSEVVWLASGLLGEGTVVSKEEFVRSNDTARLDWVTGREESDEGTPFPGRFAANVTVINDHGNQVKLLIEGFVLGQIPEIPIASGVLRKGVLTITEPVLSKIVDMATVHGVAGVDVIFHIPEEDEEPDENGENEGDEGRAGLIRIDIGRADSTGVVIGNADIQPFTGHPDFTIWVSPSAEDCRLSIGVPFDSNNPGCSFTIEDGPDFLVGKTLTTDSIPTASGDTNRYYSWGGLDDITEMFGFVGVTTSSCLDAPWYFRIFETGVMIGFPDGRTEYVASGECVTILISATTEITTDP